MTNRERILAEIRRSPGLTDRQLRERTGIHPHQQVNQICRCLQARGLIERRLGSDGHIVNLPTERASAQPHQKAPSHEAVPPRPSPKPNWPRAAHTTDDAELALLGSLDPVKTLIVFACSSSKRRGGRAALVGPRICDRLPAGLADELEAARARVAGRAQLDESALLPAMQRYSGHFYTAASTALDQAVAAARPMAVLSGGYGVLLPDEPIGWYEARFNNSWWPSGVIERVLVAYAYTLGATSMVALLSATTDYAQIVRRTHWRRAGVQDALLITPHTGGRGGAQRSVPQTSGEALRSLLADQLGPGWQSSRGLRLQVQRIDA